MSRHPSTRQTVAEHPSAVANPWLATPPPEAPGARSGPGVGAAETCAAIHVDDDLDDVPPVLTGPSAPHRHVPAPALQLRHRDHARAALVWWVGVHGGAGESTLAALVEGTAAAGHAWPTAPGVPARVVLLARTSAGGLTHAQGALTQWAAGLAGPVELLGLALLADAPGRLPTPLRHFADVVAGGAPRTWRLPWVEAWRMATPAEQAPLPAPVRRLARDVTRLVRS